MTRLILAIGAFILATLSVAAEEKVKATLQQPCMGAGLNPSPLVAPASTHWPASAGMQSRWQRPENSFNEVARRWVPLRGQQSPARVG
jgi:hypothetical protein